jgi:hypothetical protein
VCGKTKETKQAKNKGGLSLWFEFGSLPPKKNKGPKNPPSQFQLKTISIKNLRRDRCVMLY